MNRSLLFVQSYMPKSSSRDRRHSINVYQASMRVDGDIKFYRPQSWRHEHPSKCPLSLVHGIIYHHLKSESSAGRYAPLAFAPLSRLLLPFRTTYSTHRLTARAGPLSMT